MSGFVAAAPKGHIDAPADRCVRLALALGLGEHPWLREEVAPLALPELPVGVGALRDVMPYLDLCEAGDHWLDEPSNRPGFWRPSLIRRGCHLRWQPWGPGSATGRFIDIGSRSVSWCTGTGIPSRFIGAAVVAAAGGLDRIPHGLVQLVRLRPRRRTRVPSWIRTRTTRARG